MDPDPDLFGSGSASGSVSQRYGSEDPDPHTDPYKNVMDPEHWFKRLVMFEWLGFSPGSRSDPIN